MSQLKISLLGTPSLCLDKKDIFIQRRKAMALLAYLAVRKNPCSRDELTELFYPNLDRSRAKADFRQILSALRRSIGDEFLITDRFFISLNFSNGIFVDVHHFLTLIDCQNTFETFERMKEAVSLYNGPLLSGFYLDGNYAFEEWQLATQERLLWKYSSALKALLDYSKEKKSYEEAISYCRILHDLDPFDERIIREMLNLYHLTDQGNKIKELFERSRNATKQEFGEELEEETYLLFNKLIQEKTRHHTDNNLPFQKARKIGRVIESKDIMELLKNEENSLVTLVGPGGVGKTLLALYVAEEILDYFSDGVYFIDLTGIVSSDDAVTRISSILKIANNRTETINTLSNIIRYLKRKRILLVLDNFEQMKEGSTLLKDLLAGQSSLTLLVTSRIAVSIGEENIYKIPPLYLPETCCSGNNEDLELKCEAIEFFQDKARTFDPDFTVDRGNYCTVWEICHSLDGLPLALELAVSRLNVLNCEEIRDRLNTKLELLVNRNNADLPERQKTMKNAIDWSYKLLGKAEQELFIRISVFQGSCSLDAIEAISPAKTLDIVSSLISHNMVYKKKRFGETRFSMLETLREFAHMKLKEQGELRDVEQLHATYFLEKAKEAESHLYGPDLKDWIDSLVEDERNFNSAIQWFRSNSFFNEAIQIIISIQQFWYYRYYCNHGKKILYEILTEGRDIVTPEMAGKGYCALGWMSFVTGDWQNASEYYNSALVHSVMSQDKRTQSLALGRMSVVERWIGEKESGLDHGREAVEIARDLNTPYILAVSLIHLYCTRGGIFEEGDPFVFLNEALQLSEQIKDSWCLTQSYSGLGDYYREKKEFSLAEEYYNKALKLFSKNKDRWAEAWALGDLGLALCRKGENASGIEHLKKSIIQLDRIGDRGGIMLMLTRLALSLAEAGKTKLSVKYMSASQKLHDSLVNSRLNIYPLDDDLQEIIIKYRSNYEKDWISGMLMDYDNTIQSISTLSLEI